MTRPPSLPTASPLPHVDAETLLDIGTKPGPFGPQLSKRTIRKLAALPTRRALYLHYADDSAARLRYRDVLALLSSRCEGCEFALASHTPVFGGVVAPPPCLTEEGIVAHRRVLLALYHELDLDCCPALPDLVGLLLTQLSEHEAFAVARTLVDRSRKALKGPRWQALFYVATDSVTRQALNQTLAKLSGVDDATAGAWLDRLLVPVLPLKLALCLLDHLVVKGAKSLLRFGMAVAERVDVRAGDVASQVLRAERIAAPGLLPCVPASGPALDFVLLKKRNLSRAKLRGIDAGLAPMRARAEPPPPPHISRQALSQSKLTFGDFAQMAAWLEPRWQLKCAAGLKLAYSSLVHGSDLARMLARTAEDSAHVLAIGVLGAGERCVLAVYCPPGALVRTPSKQPTGDGSLFLARVCPHPKVFTVVALESRPMFSCRADGLWIGDEPALFVDAELTLGLAKDSTVLECSGLVPDVVKHDLSDASTRYFAIEFVEMFGFV